MITEILILVSVGLCTKYIWNRRKIQRCFKELGIPGPEPSFLWGHLFEMLYDGHGALQKWTKQYGKTFGYFDGAEWPVLVTSDLEFINQVYVKDFNSHFMARQKFRVPLPPQELNFNHSLFSAKGLKWKRFRSVMSQMFSGSRMRATATKMEKSLATLVEILKEKSKDGKAINTQRYFETYTMQVIASTAMGVDIDQDQNSEMITDARLAFKKQAFAQNPFLLKVLIVLSGIFPFADKLLYIVFIILIVTGALNPPGVVFFRQLSDLFQRRVKQKADGKKCPNDFLQYVLETEADVSTTSIDDTDGRPLSKKLTHAEMLANINLFMFAGFDTVSQALTLLSYELAMNPEVQSRLQREVDEVIGERPVEYDDLGKMTYLNMVFQESLRKNTDPTTVGRMCIEDTTVQGLKIPKDMSILANIPNIHRDPEIWGPTDPDKFDPERFSADQKAGRHSLAFQSFGAGPRNCVGMRLAHMETKMALATLLQHFSFTRCLETQVPPAFIYRMMRVLKDGVKLRLVERGHDLPNVTSE